MNAYEGKAGMVYLQVKLLSMPERFEIYIVYKRRYINTLPFLSFQGSSSDRLPAQISAISSAHPRLVLRLQLLRIRSLFWYSEDYRPAVSNVIVRCINRNTGQL